MKPSPPIYSRHDDDPELRDAIETFIIGLGEWIDSLQDLYSEANWKTLATRSRDLSREAEGAGYPLMVEVCTATALAADASDAEASHKQLEQLTEIIQRIRRGSRGAA